MEPVQELGSLDHIHAPAKYMDRYLAEFTFRSNYRLMQNAMLI
ncbi:hypothetical protein [Mesorhizobium sp. M0482]